MMEFKTLMENLQLNTHIVGYGSLSHSFPDFVPQHSSKTRAFIIICMIYKQQEDCSGHL